MRVVDARSEAVKLRLKGMMPESVAKELDLSVKEVNDLFSTYLLENYSELGEVELRLTQLARLESMISMLWAQVEAGDQFSEGKQTANMLKVIEEINKLMGLYRDPLRDAQVELTKAHTEKVHMIMTEMRARVLTQVLEGVREISDGLKITDGEQEFLRNQVESRFSQWYAEAYNGSIRTMKELESNHEH